MCCFRFCLLSLQLKWNNYIFLIYRKEVCNWASETCGQLFLILRAPKIFFNRACLTHSLAIWGHSRWELSWKQTLCLCKISWVAGGPAASKSVQWYSCDYRHSNVIEFRNKGIHHSIKNFPHEPFWMTGGWQSKYKSNFFSFLSWFQAHMYSLGWLSRRVCGNIWQQN